MAASLFFARYAFEDAERKTVEIRSSFRPSTLVLNRRWAWDWAKKYAPPRSGRDANGYLMVPLSSTLKMAIFRAVDQSVKKWIWNMTSRLSDLKGKNHFVGWCKQQRVMRFIALNPSIRLPVRAEVQHPVSDARKSPASFSCHIVLSQRHALHPARPGGQNLCSP